MADKIVQVPAARFVFDWNIYPRRETGVSSQDVALLTEAINAGAPLPPVIAEKGTYRLIDGFHRVPAWLRARGPDVVIDAELRTYTSDVEALADAALCNATHGRRLNQVDRRRVVLMLSAGGMDEEQIAKALYVTPAGVQRLSILVAHVNAPKSKNALTVRGGADIPLKGSTAHFAGRTMTPEQARAQKSAPGVNYALLVRQLSDALEFSLLDWENPRLVPALCRLRDLLNAAQQLTLEKTG